MPRPVFGWVLFEREKDDFHSGQFFEASGQEILIKKNKENLKLEDLDLVQNNKQMENNFKKKKQFES